MRLEDITVALRPRQPWEAVDLGLALVRRDYPRIIGLWAVTVLPVWALICGLCWRLPWLAMTLIWWLKPLYDRIPLYFISRATFGQRPGFMETFRAWPGLWSRFLFSSLFLTRLSSLRSFALPVYQLEGQRGKAVRNRLKGLALDGGGGGSAATWAFIKLETAVVIGLWTLTADFMPDSGIPSLSDMIEGVATEEEPGLAFQWYVTVLYMVAITAIEPFYAGAGFGLYLNSRIKLEGWDIELTFRRLASRLRNAAGVVAALVCFLLAGVSLSAQEAPPPAVSAATTPAPSARNTEVSESEASAKAREILAKPDFKIHTRKVKLPKVKNAPAIGNGMGALGYLFQILGYAALLALIGGLVWLIIRNRHLFASTSLVKVKPVKAAALIPKSIMGMEITRESLPEDILGAAGEAWKQGRLREALSLLYRGALAHMVEKNRLPIRESDTEDDCLVHVGKSAEERVTLYFRSLTLIWVRAAYAGLEATAEEFEDLRRRWPFGSGRVKLDNGVGPVLAKTASCLLLGFLLTGCDTEEVEIPSGYKGRARTDPFLAAQLLLREFDHAADKKNTLPKLPEPPDYSVLVVSGEAGISALRAQQLLDWCARGGHLVYPLAGCRPYNDWGFIDVGAGLGYTGNADRLDPLLELIKVKRSYGSSKKDTESADKKKKAPASPLEKKPASETERVKSAEDVPTRRDSILWGDKSLHIEMPQFVTLHYENKTRRGDYLAGTAEDASVISLVHGQGRVTVLNHARPLRNRYLDSAQHADFLLALADPEQLREVTFVVDLEGGGFLSLLWEKAWRPLVGLALLLAFWLWRNLPRFGPIRTAELHSTKHFVDHIWALGQFFHRLRRDDVLLNAAADAVRARATRLFPHLHDGGDAALIPLLVQRSGLPEERVKAALAPTPPGQPWMAVRLLQDQQTLRNSLA